MVSVPSSLAGFCMRVPSLHALVFIQKTFVTCSCCFFLGMVREKLGRWEGRLRGRRMVCKVQKYRTLLFIKNKDHHKFKASKWNCKSKQQTSLSIQGLEAQVKPHETQVQSAQVLWGFAWAYKFHRSLMLWCQNDLDRNYSLFNCSVAVMTQYYVISVGTKSMESFSGNPIVAHRKWEKLNNHQFLQLPPLVFFFPLAVDLVLLVTLQSCLRRPSYQ